MIRRESVCEDRIRDIIRARQPATNTELRKTLYLDHDNIWPVKGTRLQANGALDPVDVCFYGTSAALRSAISR